MKKIIMILGLLLSVAIIAGCSGKKMTTAPVLKEPAGIQPDKEAAYIGEIYDVTYFDSAVVPYVQELSFEMNGTVGKVYVYPGMEVKEGDLLAELDLGELQERANALQEELDHNLVVDTYTDTVTLLDIELLQIELQELKNQGASDVDIKLKENEIAQMQTDLQQAQQMRELDNKAKRSELETLNDALSKKAIYAPFSGQILHSDMLKVGAQVKAFDPVVFLADKSKLQLSGDYIKPVYFENADFIVAHIGDARYEITEKTMDEDALNSALLAGQDVQTQFDFLAPETLAGKVEAGQYAAILLYSDYIQDALIIPRDAVLTDATGSYVYVDADGSRVRRDVELGKVTDGLAQITKGLQEGEVVYVG